MGVRILVIGATENDDEYNGGGTPSIDEVNPIDLSIDVLSGGLYNGFSMYQMKEKIKARLKNGTLNEYSLKRLVENLAAVQAEAKTTLFLLTEEGRKRLEKQQEKEEVAQKLKQEKAKARKIAKAKKLLEEEGLAISDKKDN